MEEWCDLTLDQLGRIITGKTPPTSERGNYGGQIPFVTPTDMDGRRYILTTGRYLTPSGLRTVANAEIPPGSVMVSCIGSDMGKAAIAGAACVTNQQINSIIVGAAHCSAFVYYNLSVRKDEIRNAASGSAQPIMNKSTFGRLRICVPDKAEQIAIAAVLGAIDDKIELNRRMNETLEAMAQAIFKDWFVDFGPTRAKMEGRAPYLAPDIWSLFPDRLDDEGKPEGWGFFRLTDLAVHHKQGMSPSDAPDIEFEHFSLPAYDSGKSPAIDLGSTIKSNKTTVPDGAVLLSKLNPEIERVWIPEPAVDRRQVCSTEFLVFIPTDLSARSLLYGLFTEDGFRAMLQSMVTGTSKSHQRISPPSLLEREVLVGSRTAFALYEKIVGKTIERVLANRAESRTLAATRDLLLPRLMSGEIRVTAAEKIVGKVA